MKKFNFFFIIMGTLLVVHLGCIKPKAENPFNNTPGFYSRLPFILANDYNLTFFSAALSLAKLTDTLKKQGPYTVIAPDDYAFARQYYTVGNFQINPPDHLENILRHHVLLGNYAETQFTEAYNIAYPTLNGDSVFVTKYLDLNKNVFLSFDGAVSQQSNSLASNGQIYYIKNILRTPFKSIIDALEGNYGLSVFTNALMRSGLQKMLDDKSKYTVFAFTDAYMANTKYPDIMSVNKAEPDSLKKFLIDQIVNGILFTNDIYWKANKDNFALVNTLSGKTVYLTFDGINNITIRNSVNDNNPVSYFFYLSNGRKINVSASNGVLHVLDIPLNL